ncbi:MAG: hypothetical protein KA766_19775 [Piscinibacter sp.]|uniref:hypothetical protein n=1 Tax=Piscinibacter sp. TaxID=1903157 RepID=UPI0011D730C6|nr:hypothetical protein [Piscinibacter sp.]MBP5992244.1 hypothetical protein [Piscinibacter sp.]MBP6028183.1 hypothetical protein [Piscinibacter sp.]TXH59762.1 MAG: hypothetical protein E6Q93_08145 [Burkholderiaceae bacterium]
MSAEAASLVRSWSVGDRYTVTMTMPPIRRGQVLSASIEWAPEYPERLTPHEMAEYRRGRNEAIRSLGLRAVVVDL